MAITTLDGVVAGMLPAQRLHKQGTTMESPVVDIMHSLFYANGRPGAATAPSPGVNGAALTSYAGQIPFSTPVSGTTHLAMFEACASQLGRLVLCDRLWHNSGIVVTTTGAQAIVTPTWPARDANGATLGEGVLIAIEVSTATTNGAVTSPTISYTNSAGVAGRTGTMSNATGQFPVTAVAGTFATFALQAGDTGVRSVQSITLGTSLGAGAIHLVAYRPLATLDITVANVGASKDVVALGMPRLYDDTVPFLVWNQISTTAVNISGQLVYTQG